MLYNLDSDWPCSVVNHEKKEELQEEFEKQKIPLGDEATVGGQEKNAIPERLEDLGYI